MKLQMDLIISRFSENVQGKSQPERINISHDGETGHWLETQMGVQHNSDCKPDLFGYEMKKDASKITFGDWSASEYTWSKTRDEINSKNGWTSDVKISRNNHIQYFGTIKDDRYSWSGSCFPTYKTWNSSGQLLDISDNFDICIYYNYERDTRESKNELPIFLKEPRDYLIAFWKSDKIKKHVEEKFNQKGFFIIKQTNGVYTHICFGRPFSFECFIEFLKTKKIYIDSGMHHGNPRNYSSFRAASQVWHTLIYQTYPTNT